MFCTSIGYSRLIDDCTACPEVCIVADKCIIGIHTLGGFPASLQQQSDVGSASFRSGGPHVLGQRDCAVTSAGKRSTTAESVDVNQRIEAVPSITRSQRFSLGDFTGDNYSKGRSWPLQLLWMAVSRYITMQWWCPNRLRVAVLRAFGAQIGTGTLIRHDVKIHWPWKLEIGDHTWIGESTWILNLEPVAIGSNTCISQGVLLCTGSHDRFSPTFEFDNGPITVGDAVWIAAQATILRGVHVAHGATVGATALVTGDVGEGATILAPRSLPVVKS
jgi:putative colanic acid biosynthesis acetyltransferase WcaF